MLASHDKQHRCVEMSCSGVGAGRGVYKLHLPKRTVQTCWNFWGGVGGGAGAGLNFGTHDRWLVNTLGMKLLDAAHSEVTTVEWVKRSQSRNCSLNMCHTLKCGGKHPYTHQYDEQKSPKPKLWSLYFCYRERKKIYILENKNKSQNRRGRKKRLQILRWMQRKNELHELGETLRHEGLFPGARLLISKSTGLDDPRWSNGVHEDACINNASTVGVLAGGPRVTLCAPGCLVLSSLWVACRGRHKQQARGGV